VRKFQFAFDLLWRLHLVILPKLAVPTTLIPPRSWLIRLCSSTNYTLSARTIVESRYIAITVRPSWWKPFTTPDQPPVHRVQCTAYPRLKYQLRSKQWAIAIRRRWPPDSRLPGLPVGFQNHQADLDKFQCIGQSSRFPKSQLPSPLFYGICILSTEVLKITYPDLRQPVDAVNWSFPCRSTPSMNFNFGGIVERVEAGLASCFARHRKSQLAPSSVPVWWLLLKCYVTPGTSVIAKIYSYKTNYGLLQPENWTNHLWQVLLSTP